MFDSKVHDSENQTTPTNNTQCSIEMKHSKSSFHSKSSTSSSSTFLEHVCHEGCIHAVAKTGDCSKIIYFIESNSGSELSALDEDGRSALHLVNFMNCSCGACVDHAESCMKCLLAVVEGENINSQDMDGNTPLHVALQYQNDKSAKLLLQYGADVSIRNLKGEDSLTLMATSFPDVMVAVLDQAIAIEKFYPNSEKCVLRLDFGMVVGFSEQDEVKKPSFKKELTLLNSVLGASRYSRTTILTHPLVVLFLDQKWKRVRKFFATFFFCYLFWLLAYTSYIVKVYLVSCPCEFFSKSAMKKTASEPPGALVRSIQQNGTNVEEKCHLETGFTSDAIIVLLLTIVMAINEIVKIITIPSLYIRNKINVGSWILIAMVIITTGPITMSKDSKLEAWQYQAAALAIFLSWALILSQLGSIPSLGRYVEILGHVLKNFSLSMLTFSSLFMAFALSFNVLFPGSEPFSHFFFAILKVLVMMTGEVDYQDMFYDNDREATTGPIVGHILYAAFVIIISIVLMNLLIGLTVSDIQALQKEAELSRVFRQISEMLSLESTCFSNRLGGRIGRFLQGSISVTRHKKHSGSRERFGPESQPFIDNLFFRFRPNDHSDKSVPPEHKAAALQIAVSHFHTNGNACRTPTATKSGSDKSVHFESTNA